MNETDLVREITAAFKKLDERLNFGIVEEGIRQDNDWWYVRVIPEMKDGRLAARDFTVNVLAGVESKLFEQFKENVLLIPATK